MSESGRASPRALDNGLGCRGNIPHGFCDVVEDIGTFHLLLNSFLLLVTVQR